MRGPGVADLARAFADSWAASGPPLPASEVVPAEDLASEGTVALRVVASTPGTAGLFRLDTLVAALARKSLWLTDAYFAGTGAYVQALRAAAQDGVDVRLLVPGRGSDIAFMQAAVAGGLPAPARGGGPRLRVERPHGPCQDARSPTGIGPAWVRPT